jgi:hypothetical protein
MHRRLRLGGSKFWISLGKKKFGRPRLDGRRLSMVANACYLSKTEKFKIGES